MVPYGQSSSSASPPLQYQIDGIQNKHSNFQNHQLAMNAYMLNKIEKNEEKSLEARESIGSSRERTGSAHYINDIDREVAGATEID
ncbi:hypothetical protein ACLB2K_020472 [Fragaria x ananassa]